MKPHEKAEKVVDALKGAGDAGLTKTEGARHGSMSVSQFQSGVAAHRDTVTDEPVITIDDRYYLPSQTTAGERLALKGVVKTGRWIRTRLFRARNTLVSTSRRYPGNVALGILADRYSEVYRAYNRALTDLEVVESGGKLRQGSMNKNENGAKV